MQPIVTTVGPLTAALANNICLSQSPTAAAGFTLNGSLVSGGVAYLDTPRRVLFTFAANETGHTITLRGANLTGQSQSETIAGTTAGTVYSVLDYATVTSISISVNSTGAITVGTNGVASSAWVRLDGWGFPNIGLACVVTGTVNYTVQQTYDDPNSPTNPVGVASVNWQSSPDSNVVAATASKQSGYEFIPVFTRLLLNSGTGSVTMTVLQSGYDSLIPTSNPTLVVTGTSFTPTSDISGGLIVCTSASAVTITANDLGQNVAYSVQQQGAGAVTINAGVGVTMISAADGSTVSSVTTAVKGSVITIISNGSGTVFAAGGIS